MANTKNRRARPTAADRSTKEPPATEEVVAEAQESTAPDAPEEASPASGPAELHVASSEDAAEPSAPPQEDFEGEEVAETVQLEGEGLDAQDGGADSTEEFLKGLVEAILFTADQPLSVRDVARAFVRKPVSWTICCGSS